MTAAQLQSWFSQAQAGDRIAYYAGNLGQARADKHVPSAREIVEVADAARNLGTPQAYQVFVNRDSSSVRRFGQGLAYLSQRRVGKGRFEYYITKALREVLR